MRSRDFCQEFFIPISPKRYCIKTDAAIVAVSALKTRGPRVAVINPQAFAFSISCDVNPPSGPIMINILLKCLLDCDSAKLTGFDSFSQKAIFRLLCLLILNVSSNDTVGPISIIRPRLHCLRASFEIFFHRFVRSASRLLSGLGTERLEIKGTHFVIPSSVSCLTSLSIFFCFKKAWATII